MCVCVCVCVCINLWVCASTCLLDVAHFMVVFWYFIENSHCIIFYERLFRIYPKYIYICECIYIYICVFIYVCIGTAIDLPFLWYFCSLWLFGKFEGNWIRTRRPKIMTSKCDFHFHFYFYFHFHFVFYFYFLLHLIFLNCFAAFNRLTELFGPHGVWLFVGYIKHKAKVAPKWQLIN